MAYKFQLDSAIMSGSLLQVGAVNGATSLSGATSVSGQTATFQGLGDFGSLTVATGSTIGTDGAGSDLMTLTANTLTLAANSVLAAKAVTASVGLTSLGTVSGSTTANFGGAVSGSSTAIFGHGVTGSHVRSLGDLIIGRNADIAGTLIAGATTLTSLTASGVIELGGNMSCDGTVSFNNTLTLSGATDVTVNVGSDSIYLLAASDGKMRRDTFISVADAMAGAGITAVDGQFTVQSNAVSGAQDGEPLSEGYNYFTGTVSATATLPAIPAVGDVVTVKAGNTAAGEVITIQRVGSHLIDEDATSVLLESPYAAITFVFMKANDWRII